MTPLDYKDFRKFVQNWVKSQPHRGRGQFRQMALFCDMSTVLVSQIFKGTREISLEKAFKLTEFLELDQANTEYFLLLVQISRAGNRKLKSFLIAERDKKFEKAHQLKEKIPNEIELSNEQLSQFHSDWTYSAIRLGSSIPQLKSPKAMAEKFDIPLEKVKQIIEFLLDTGLCKMEEGALTLGPSQTFLPAHSPLVKNRQVNWRLKGFEKMDHTNAKQLFFTGPLTVSTQDAQKVRKILTESIEKVSAVVSQSEAEELHCLNIDWFNLLK